MSIRTNQGRLARAFRWARQLVDKVVGWAKGTIFWRMWERMLEVEFVDRSVALAGKAFVSFFPLVIVVAAFAPPGVRSAIFTSITNRLGVRGAALEMVKPAFATADDTRKATGIGGLILTFFFASSFTTALQRVYMRAWRRPSGLKIGAYTRGPAWLAVLLGYMALTGLAREAFGGHVGLGVFVVVALSTSVALWWFSIWFLLLGHVRWRVLLPSALISAVAMLGYAVSASIWMPSVVSSNESQFGFFGVALALVTWFSGAATCIMVGACAGVELAEDDGPVGRFVRGPQGDTLMEGSPPALPPPAGGVGIRDAFRKIDET